MLAHVHQVAVVERAGNFQTHPFEVQACVGHDRQLQPGLQFLQRTKVIRMCVSEQNTDRLSIGQHLQQRLRLGARVNQHALPGGGADQYVGIHWPGTDRSSSQFQFRLWVGHGSPRFSPSCDESQSPIGSHTRSICVTMISAPGTSASGIPSMSVF